MFCDLLNDQDIKPGIFYEICYGFHHLVYYCKEEQEICNQLNRRTEFIVLRTTYNLFDKDGQLKNPPKAKQKKFEENNKNGINISFEQ